VFDGSASAFEYFGGALHSSDSHVLAGVYRTFAQVAGPVNGMKRHQVAGGFSCSFSSAADAFRRSFADIGGATSDIMFRAGVDVVVGLGVADVCEEVEVCAPTIPARQIVAESNAIFIRL
jgi:hypothetical protein